MYSFDKDYVTNLFPGIDSLNIGKNVMIASVRKDTECEQICFLIYAEKDVAERIGENVYKAATDIKFGFSTDEENDKVLYAFIELEYEDGETDEFEAEINDETGAGVAKFIDTIKKSNRVGCVVSDFDFRCTASWLFHIQYESYESVFKKFKMIS